MRGTTRARRKKERERERKKEETVHSNSNKSDMSICPSTYVHVEERECGQGPWWKVKISNYPRDAFAVVVVTLSRRIFRTKDGFVDGSLDRQYSCLVLVKQMLADLVVHAVKDSLDGLFLLLTRHWITIAIRI